MTKPSKRALAPLLSLLFIVATATGQVTTGVPPFSSVGGGTFDTIDLQNLNVHFAIPFIHKAGRGMPFTYDFSYDSSVWYSASVNGVVTWQPVSNFGWRGLSEAAVGYISNTSSTGMKCQPSGFSSTLSNYVFHDMSGVPHTFSGHAVISCAGDITGFSSQAYDGSGYTLNVDTNADATITSPTGHVLFPPQNLPTGGGSVRDTNGNSMAVSSTGVFTDTLGTQVLSVTGGAPNPLVFAYTGPNSTQPQYKVNYTAYNIKTNFACSGIVEYTSTSAVSMVSSVSLPDGSSYNFTYESTPGFSGYITGRLAQVTLATGGTINYAYNYADGHNGIVCSDGSADGLTRTVNPGGQWTYTRTQVSGAQWQTKITSPPDSQNTNSNADDTIIDFQGLYETQRRVYQGPSTGTLLQTSITCYNGNSVATPSNCPTTAVTLPILRKTRFNYLPDTTGVQAEIDSTYNQSGLIQEVDAYNFGTVGGAVGSLINKTITTYATLGNGIVGRPATVKVEDASNAVLASTTYGYDETAVTATTGTPSHGLVTGSRGNLTSVANQANSSATLYRKFSYYDTGNLNTSTGVSTSSSANGPITTYNYAAGAASCSNSFVTSISEPLSLSRSMTWDCAGGVATSQTDENGQPTSVSYADPNFWRPSSTSDQLSNVTSLSYLSPTAAESAMLFNSNNSVADRRAKVDGLGRPIVSQVGRSPNPTTYDSTETDYDVFGRSSKTTLPYAGSADALCSGSCPGTTTVYDAAGRVKQITDSGGGSVSYTYTYNDIYQSIAAPSGENAKRKQLEYDSLGRLQSVCEVTSGVNSQACGQSSAATGYLTSYTYDVLGNLKSVTQKNSAATQTRTYTYDMLGRLTSETNPESGQTTYVYDTTAVTDICGTAGRTSAGDRLQRNDAKGVTTCYSYDGLHRVTDVGNSAYSSSNPCKRFRYDNTNGILGSKPTGVAIGNSMGRLAEAETDNCTWPVTQTTQITDEWFSYSARGEITDTWESTPNSGGYYHPTAGFWANGAIKSLWISSLPNITYGVDGEGRTSTVSSSTGQNPVTATSYNGFGQITNVTFGSGDTDAFTFDPNSGRMTQYKYSVNGSSEIGNLTWNGNGSLKTLAITDPFNAGDAQTCNYSHDDLSRLANANCGSVWSQTFSYDSFGNVTKSGSISWQPGYTPSTNRYALGGTSYDANGNLLNDSFHTYTWNASSRPITIDTIGLTYDAFDRMVEQNKSGTFYQVVYTPLGSKLGIFQGQTIQQLYLPLPGGAQAEYLSWGLSHYRHADWLGSNRLESSTTRTILDNNAYAPFGEPYAQTGNGEISFTGQNKDTDWLQYDFLARQYDPKQGRWISPDPAGLGAVDLVNPQTWNRYAYVANNPLGNVDPLGLFSPGPCGVNGCGGGGFDPCFFSGLFCGNPVGPPGPPDGPPGGGGGGHKPGKPAGPPPKPPVLKRGQPECFAQMKSRAVDVNLAQAIGATHSFWYVQDTIGNQSIVSGGPTGPNGDGFLDIWVSSDINGRVDNVFAHTSWDSGMSADNCNKSDNLMTAADTWPQDTIPYQPPGPNSNTVAHYLGVAGGFSTGRPSGAWGWYTALPSDVQILPGAP